MTDPWVNSSFGVADAQAAEDEHKDDNVLRPKSFDEFVGHERLRENLSVYVEAAKRRGDTLDHVLLYGPPGLGKSTLSMIVANEMGVPMHATSGPALERPKDLAATLTRLQEGAVLFIDEIHRMPVTVEEFLYPAMEDFSIDLMVGEGPAARSIKISLNRFTLVGATTRTSLLSAPLRDRFGLVERLDYYEQDELAKIAARSSDILGFSLTDDGQREVARRSRGTPRIANRILKRVRDFAEVAGQAPVDGDFAGRALDRVGIDPIGLHALDLAYLHALGRKFGGGPTGLATLAAALGDDRQTLEEFVEPYLIRLGMVDRTPRGRVLTDNGRKHIGVASTQAQEGLFR